MHKSCAEMHWFDQNRWKTFSFSKSKQQKKSLLKKLFYESEHLLKVLINFGGNNTFISCILTQKLRSHSKQDLIFILI
jgi:hypothetical protein